MDLLTQNELYLKYSLFICTSILFFLTIKSYYYNSLNIHPFYKKNRWIIFPAIIMDNIYNNFFGKTDGTWKSLFTIRSILISIGISVVINVAFLIILHYIKPSEVIFDTQVINFLIKSYTFFIFFNALGDIVSIAFTRFVLYKIVHLEGGNVNKYILKEFFGIILGYFITFIPILVIGLMFYFESLNESEVTILLKDGFIGILFVPFIYLIFITTSATLFLYKFFAFFALFSIAIPTIFFLFVIIIVYFINIEDTKVYKVDLNTGKTGFLCKHIIIFFGFLLSLQFFFKGDI